MENRNYSLQELYPIILRTYKNELNHTVCNCIRYLKGKCRALNENNIKLDPKIENRFYELMKKIEYDAYEKSLELEGKEIRTTENIDISRRSDFHIFDEWGLDKIDINTAINFFNRLYSFLCTKSTIEDNDTSRTVALGIGYENKMMLLGQILCGKIPKFDINDERKK